MTELKNIAKVYRKKNPLECLGDFFFSQSSSLKQHFKQHFKVPQKNWSSLCFSPSPISPKTLHSTYIYPPATAASPGSLLEMQNLRPHPRPTEWYLHFHKMPTWLVCRLKSKKQRPKSDLSFLTFKCHLDWPLSLAFHCHYSSLDPITRWFFFLKSHNWFIYWLILTLIYSSNIYWDLLSARPGVNAPKKTFSLWR